jgi:hypothetical protein
VYVRLSTEVYALYNAMYACAAGIASVKVLASAYAKEMSTATAQAIAKAYASPTTCGVEASACAETGGAYPKEYACCVVKVDNYPEDLSKDALAEAGVSFAQSKSLQCSRCLNSHDVWLSLIACVLMFLAMLPSRSECGETCPDHDNR